MSEEKNETIKKIKQKEQGSRKTGETKRNLNGAGVKTWQCESVVKCCYSATGICMLYLFLIQVLISSVLKILCISYADIFCNTIPKRKTGSNRSIYNCDNKNGTNMI